MHNNSPYYNKNHTMKLEELKLGWGYAVNLKQIQLSINLEKNVYLNDTEIAVLCFIAHSNSKISVTGIIEHPHFSFLSRSTVKRAVAKLLREKLIQSLDSSNDRRERLLSIIEE